MVISICQWHVFVHKTHHSGNINYNWLLGVSPHGIYLGISDMYCINQREATLGMLSCSIYYKYELRLSLLCTRVLNCIVPLIGETKRGCWLLHDYGCIGGVGVWTIVGFAWPCLGFCGLIRGDVGPTLTPYWFVIVLIDSLNNRCSQVNTIKFQPASIAMIWHD